MLKVVRHSVGSLPKTGDVANQALEPTPNNLRSSLAPAIGRGSPPAFGTKNTVALQENLPKKE